MRWARVIGAVGRTFIGIGALLLLFVAYQLWGTGIQEARAQNRLGDEFEAALATTSTTRPPSVPQRPSVSTTVVDLPPPPIEGDAMAQIEIPSIGVKKYVVEGVGVADLKQGPGHYPGTPLPGQVGNAAIAGHRTTYDAPFYRLNELEDGDEIIVRTLQGEFTYIVDDKLVVQPDQTEVLDQTDDARLTLTTCEPRFSARRRLIIVAILDDEPAPSPASTSEPTPTPTDDEEPEPLAFEEAGLSGDPAARWPTFWWGLWAALAGIVTYIAARRWRPFWAYLAGSPVFFLLLFIFFENVSRLLPANI